MNEENKILEIVSNEAKNSIEGVPVVTPSIYASIFAEFAQKHNLEIQNEEDISNEIIKSQCTKFTQLQEETSKSVQSLSENTDKAINAIQNKDDTLLNQVLQETKSLRHEIEKLKESVYKDELTHAYNRKWLHDNYINETGDSFNKEGTLAIIDLNYFKQINDTHGHIIGDKVLIYVTNALKKLKVPVIRYGGDEFIVIFKKNIPKEKALSLLNKIREDIIAKKLKAHNDTFHVSFSFGLNEFHKDDALTKIIEEADKDMYHDKIEIKKRVTGI